MGRLTFCRCLSSTFNTDSHNERYQEHNCTQRGKTHTLLKVIETERGGGERERGQPAGLEAGEWWVMQALKRGEEGRGGIKL